MMGWVYNWVQRPEMQWLGRFDMIDVGEDQVCDWMYGTYGSIANSEYVQGVSNMGYKIKS